MRILVTGGDGFIGRHLVRELSMDHEVLVIDNKSPYNRDILNKESIEHLFIGADYVFHLAAESRIQPAIKNPQLAYTTNVVGTLNVLELSRKHNIKKVIYSSTSSVYGLTQDLPTKENAQIKCLNPYAHSKYIAEDLFRHYSDVSSIILRYFNVFGEDSPIDSPYCPVLGIFIEQKKNRQPLTIVGDGRRRRDFVYVKDVVSANIAAMNSPIGKSEVFNIGSGRNISIQEIADLIYTEQVYIPDRPGEADNTLADINKSKLIGWSPKIFVEDWLKSL